MAGDGEVGDGVAYPLAALPAALLLIDGTDDYVGNPPAVALLGSARGSVLDLFAATEAASVARFLADVRRDGAGAATLQLAPGARDERATTTGPDAPGAPGAPQEPDAPGQFRPDLETIVPLPRFVELRGQRAADGAALLVAVVDVTETVRAREVLESVVVSTWIMDDQARVLWGPFGRDSERVGRADHGSLAAPDRSSGWIRSASEPWSARPTRSESRPNGPQSTRA